MKRVDESDKAIRPQSVYSVLVLLGILSVGGMQGGWHLMADPSGQWMAISPDRFSWLITDFFMPGLFIFLLFGFSPLFLAYALLTRLNGL